MKTTYCNMCAAACFVALASLVTPTYAADGDDLCDQALAEFQAANPDSTVTLESCEDTGEGYCMVSGSSSSSGGSTSTTP